MKKFLAMLLACVMILSMLPITTFAAEESADHSHCPGEGAVHTVANCAHAVTLETVPGDCVSYGYTVYQCPECDKVFADNFVKPTGAEAHSFEEIEAAVPATCTTDGKTAVVKCELCDTVAGGEVIPAAVGGHKWEKVDVVVGDNGCTVNYKCSVCGETKADEGAHDWSDKPTKIVTKPGYYTPGEAEYTCETCGKVKPVVILPEHDCNTSLTYHKAVTATCDKAGNVEYWECECGKLYNSSVAVEANEIETVVVKATGHNYDTTKGATLVETLVPASCKNVGSAKIACANCGKVETREVAKLPHTYDPKATEYQAPTCDTYGYILEVCTVCGWLEKAKAIPPLDHTPYECPEHETEDAECEVCADAKLSKEKNYAEPNCTEAGEKTWKCGRCDIDRKIVVEATGHETEKVEVEARCAHYAYWFTYCTNENCTAELKSEVTITGKDADGKEYTDTYDVKVGDKGVHLIECKDIPEGGYDPNNHTRDVNESKIINDSTCTESGNEVYYCADCDYIDENMVIAPKGHAYTVEVKRVPENCTTAEKITMKCVRCDATEVKNGKSATGHDYGEAQKVAATCHSKGYTYKTCGTCGHVEKYDEKSVVEYQNYYNSKEDANAIHEYTGTWSVLREGNCKIRGMWMSDEACAHCGKYLLAIIDDSGKGHVEPDWEAIAKQYGIQDFNPDEDTLVINIGGKECFNGKDATCLEDGFSAQYICQSCGEFVESVEKKAVGAHDKINVTAAEAPTCTKSGKTEGYTCKACGEVVVSQVIPALEHDWIEIDSASQDCLQYGYIHNECKNCKDEVIISYIDAMGHDLETTTVSAPTCEVAGKTATVCKNGCSYDDYEKEGTIPATGHKNAKGETIVNACTDKVTDRICVNENCDYADGKVPTDHTAYSETYGEKTCKSYAYVLKSCTDCGMYEMVENTIDGYGPHSWTSWMFDGWKVTVEPTYHETGVKVRECYVCGHTEQDTVPVLEGLGVFVEADNAAVAGASIVESSLVKVTVSIDANKVNVWGYDMAVSFNPEALEYVGADFSNATFGVNTVSTAADKVDGVVKVAANYKNTEGGLTQNLNVNAKEVLVDLYFRVLGDVAETYVYCTDIEVITKDGKDAVEFVDYMNSTAMIEVDQFLDADNDGEVTLADCQIAYKILIGEPLEEGAEAVIYDATLDVDKDGVITVIDVQMLYDYLVGNYDYEDMVAAGIE